MNLGAKDYHFVRGLGGRGVRDHYNKSPQTKVSKDCRSFQQAQVQSAQI
jgi:hypothetical protein